jgi:hypothetical protein
MPSTQLSSSLSVADLHERPACVIHPGQTDEDDSITTPLPSQHVADGRGLSFGTARKTSGRISAIVTGVGPHGTDASIVPSMIILNGVLCHLSPMDVDEDTMQRFAMDADLKRWHCLIGSQFSVTTSTVQS